jgi:hypothetical protein
MERPLLQLDPCSPAEADSSNHPADHEHKGGHAHPASPGPVMNASFLSKTYDNTPIAIGTAGKRIDVLPPFVDFIQGNVRSPALLFLTFFFLIGAAMLFFVLLLSEAPQHGYTLRFLAPPPATVTLGEAFRKFSVVAVRPNEAAYADTKLRVTLRPAEPFPIYVNYGFPHVLVQSRTVDCQVNDAIGSTGHAFGQLDDTLCCPESLDNLLNFEVVTDEQGLAEFAGVTLMSGPPGLWILRIDRVHESEEGEGTRELIDGESNAITATLNVVLARPAVSLDGYSLKGNDPTAKKMLDYGVFNWPISLSGTVEFDSATDAATSHALSVQVISPPMPPFFEYYPVNYIMRSTDAGSAAAFEPTTINAPVTNVDCHASNSTLVYRCKGAFSVQPVLIGGSSTSVSLVVYFAGATQSFHYSEFDYPDIVPLTIGSSVILDSGTSNVTIEPTSELPAEVRETDSFPIAVRLGGNTQTVGNIVFFSAVYDPVSNESVWNNQTYFVSKFLSTNVSESSDESGRSVTETTFSSLGEPGKYDVWAHVGSAHQFLGSIVVRTRVATLCGEAPETPSDDTPSPHCRVVQLQVPVTGTMNAPRAEPFVILTDEGMPIPGKRLSFHLYSTQLSTPQSVRFSIDAAAADRQGYAILYFVSYFVPDHTTAQTWLRVVSDQQTVGWLSLNTTFVGVHGTLKGCYPPVIELVDPMLAATGRAVYLSTAMNISADSSYSLPNVATPIFIGHNTVCTAYFPFAGATDAGGTVLDISTSVPVVTLSSNWQLPQHANTSIVTLQCRQTDNMGCTGGVVSWLSFVYTTPFTSLDAVSLNQYKYKSALGGYGRTGPPPTGGGLMTFGTAMGGGSYDNVRYVDFWRCSLTADSTTDSGTIECDRNFIPMYRSSGYFIQFDGAWYQTRSMFTAMARRPRPCSAVFVSDTLVQQNTGWQSSNVVAWDVAVGLDSSLMTSECEQLLEDFNVDDAVFYIVAVPTNKYVEGMTALEVEQYNCWVNADGIMSGWPCLASLAWVGGTVSAPVFQVVGNQSTSVTFVDIAQTTGSFMLLYYAPILNATGVLNNGQPITQQPVQGVTVFDANSLVVTSPPPYSVSYQQRFGFTVDTNSAFWARIGLLATVQCYVGGTKIPVRFQIDIMMNEEYAWTYAAPGLFISADGVLAVSGIWFDSTVPAGPIDIFVGLPDGSSSPTLSQVGTVNLGTQSCFVALLPGSRGAPPQLRVDQLFEAFALVTCGGLPAPNLGVKASISSTDFGCVGPQCGVLRGAGSFGITNGTGIVQLQLVVTSIAPNSTFYITLTNINYDTEGANVQVTAVQGRAAPRITTTGVASRLFSTAEAGLEFRNAQSLRLGPILAATFVSGVEIVEQPEVECSLTREMTAAECEPMKGSASVKVYGADGKALPSAFVSYLVFLAEDLRTPVAGTVIDCEEASCAVGVLTDAEGEAAFPKLKFQGTNAGAYCMIFFAHGTASAASNIIKVEAQDSDVNEMKDQAERAAFVLVVALMPVLIANTTYRSKYFVAAAFLMAVAFSPSRLSKASPTNSCNRNRSCRSRSPC